MFRIRRSNPQEGGLMPDIGSIVELADYILSSPRRRHIVGGTLLSVSFLFGGLALTALTIRKDEETDE